MGSPYRGLSSGRTDVRFRRFIGRWVAIGVAAVGTAGVACGGAGSASIDVDSGTTADAQAGNDSTVPPLDGSSGGDATNPSEGGPGDAGFVDASGDGAADADAGNASDASDSGDAGSTQSDAGDAGDAAQDAALACLLPGACVVDVPIPTTSSTQSGVTVVACPGGPAKDAGTPQCILEIDLGNAALAIDGGTVSGTIPMRVQDLPWSATVGTSKFSVQTALGDAKGGTCSGSQPPPVGFLPLSVQLTLTAADGGPPPPAPVLGCDSVAVTTPSVSVSASDLVVCGCPLPAVFCTLATDVIASSVGQAIASELATVIDDRACRQ
jgi:hypothetical protein